MELAETLRRRRMVRRYTDAPVDSAALGRVLDAARRAPSAGFAQGQTFVVVTSAEARAAVAAAAGEPAYRASGHPPWVSAAPVLIVPCTSRAAYEARYAEHDKAHAPGPEGWDVPWWWVDAGAALMALMLAAVAEGLATGLLGVPRERLAAAVDLRSGEEPLGVLTLGHPHPDDRPVGSALRPRRPRDEVVRRV